MPDAPDVPERESGLDTAGVWAAMSHEIRTPLMGVVGMLEILTRTSLTDEQRRIIATAGESSVALMRIVDDVLDLAKLESPHFSLAPSAADVRELLEGCAELLANQADAKGLPITCEADDAIPVVMCDVQRLRQVLLNLGANAVKFTESGQVDLTVQLVDQTAGSIALRFIISDSGLGIPPELHAFLFRPFSQLAVTAGRGLGGVGLGLAICRSLVEAMGGKIAIESTPGRGTRFTIDLRFPPALPVGVQGPRSPNLAGHSIVAIDAGEPALHIAIRYLEAAGAAVRRIGALSNLGGNTLAAVRENEIVLVGPDAEAEDVQAATATLSLRNALARPSVLWLHPRAVGGAQVLARRGVRAVRAHPLRRAALLEAVTEARPLLADAQLAVLTRRIGPPSFGFGDEEAAAIARAEGRVILVAEDNAVNQEVLRQQLAILGFDCDIAVNGSAALQALHERPYLLLLCDCHMPGMDGFELTRQIRDSEIKGKVRLPIIAVTANAMAGEPERCRAAGMDDYLSKPIEISNLKAALERWLDTDVQPLAVGISDGEMSMVMDAGAIDLKNLKAVFGNDAARLKPVLDQWRAVIEEACKDLRTASAVMRWEEVGVVAHRIKGSAGVAGAHGLSAAAVSLEAALQTNDVAAVARESARLLEIAATALAQVRLWNDEQDGSSVARTGRVA